MPVMIWECNKCSNKCYYFPEGINFVKPDNCILAIDGTNNKANWKEKYVAIIEIIREIKE